MGKEMRHGGDQWMPGEEWVKGALWNGIGLEDSRVAEIKLIYPVMEDGHQAEENGDKIWAYIPANQYPEFHEARSIPVGAAVQFMVPERPAGIADKFEKAEKYAGIRP